MSVKLRKRKNSDGTTSLYLDIYHNGKREYEFLKHLKLNKAANPLDRQANKENLLLAEKIMIKRAQDLSANDYSIITDTGKKTIVTEWMQSFIDTYKKKDKRNLQGALNRFKDFLIQEKKQGLTFGSLTELVISDYQDYLIEHSQGEGASSYFSRFKKMVKQAYRQKMIKENPAAEVKTKQGKAKRKDIMTMDEISLLAQTETESTEVKRAFLFSCVTGLRWSDIKSLTWESINLKEAHMIPRINKTNEDAYIELNDTAIELLGKKGKSSDLVFNLPTANGANKTVKAWVKRAGIEKKITWHNARHSFGTNLIFHGADVTTTSRLMSHTSTKHTGRYVRTAAELKRRATDQLNISLQS